MEAVTNMFRRNAAAARGQPARSASHQWDDTRHPSAAESSVPTSPLTQQETMSANDSYSYLPQLRLNEEASRASHEGIWASSRPLSGHEHSVTTQGSHRESRIFQQHESSSYIGSRQTRKHHQASSSYSPDQKKDANIIDHSLLDKLYVTEVTKLEFEIELAEEEKTLFDGLFREADEENIGVVLRKHGMEFFVNGSGLNFQVIGRIWDIADPRKRGLLTKLEFCLALRLIGQVQSGQLLNKYLASKPGPLPKFGQGSKAGTIAHLDYYQVADDPEFDYELANIYQGLARKNMEVGSFANAEMQWRKILDITKDKTEPGHIWELIYCLERQSNLKEALSFLHIILDRSIRDDNLKERYSVQDRMAGLYFVQHNYELAKRHATTALWGRRRILGTQDQKYFDTMSLLASILEGKGEHIEAEAYRVILKDSEVFTRNSTKGEVISSGQIISQVSVVPESVDPMPHIYATFSPPKPIVSKPHMPTCLDELLAARKRMKKATSRTAYSLATGFLLYSVIAVTDGTNEATTQPVSSFARSYLEACKPFVPNLKFPGLVDQHVSVFREANLDGREAIIRPLAVAGSPRYTYGHTYPLHIAALAHNYAAVRALLLHCTGVDVNCRNQANWTPLYIAVYEQEDSTINFLLGRGADPDLYTNDHYTPLMHAAQMGYTSIVGVLLQYGACKDLKDCNGNTALSIAANNGCQTAMELLIGPCQGYRDFGGKKHAHKIGCWSF